MFSSIKTIFRDRLGHHLMEVLHGASVAFLFRAAATLLTFVFNLALARLLGPAGAGIFFLAFTVAAVASVISRLGLDHALLRFVASGAETDDWDQVAGVSRLGIKTAGLAALFVSLLVFILSPIISAHVFREPSLVVPLRIISAGIIPLSLTALHSEMLRGLKEVAKSIMVHWQGFLVPLISLPLLLLSGSANGPAGAAASYMASAWVTLFAAHHLWTRAAPEIRGIKGHFDTRLLVTTSLPLLLVASVNMVMNWTDTVMLGVFTDSESVGIYGIAMRISLLTGFALVSINTIAAPKFAALYAKGMFQELKNLAKKTTRIMTLSVLPVCLFFIFLPGVVLGFFGESFLRGGLVLAILTVGQFFNVAVGSVAYLLVMTGHQNTYQKIIVTSAVINVLLNLILIPLFKIHGAALATAVSLVFNNIAAMMAVRRKLGFFTIG
jgi:O-antigen/teichoic acid export membrane protein